MGHGMKSRWRCFAVVGLIFSPLLEGCSRADSVQEALGYEQRGPDEMAVIKRPPLIVPPDYNLRPPRAADQTAGNVAASNAARRTLIGPSSSLENGSSILNGKAPGTDAAGQETISEGQDLLVSRANRTVLDLDDPVETRTQNRIDSSLLRRLLTWGSEDREAEGATVQVLRRSQTVIDPESSPSE